MNCLMKFFTSFSRTDLLKILNRFVVSSKHYTNWNNHFECDMKSLKTFSNHWVLNSSILTTTCSSARTRRFTSLCMWMIFWSLMKIWITSTKSRANWAADSKMHNLKSVQHYLSIEIVRDNDSILFRRINYLKKMLKRFEMKNCKSIDSSMKLGLTAVMMPFNNKH